MKDDKALIKELKAERAALVGELKDAREKIRKSERRVFAAEKETDKKISRLQERENRLKDLETAAAKRYEIALKELELFCDRIKRLSDSGEPILKKAEIIDLFKDFLKNKKGLDAKEAVKKVSETLKEIEEKEGSEDIDLDEILNFKGDADLQKLCEDLGVYKGEE